VNGFRWYHNRAARLIASPRQLRALLNGAVALLDGRTSMPAALDAVRSEVRTGVDLLGSWQRGEYQGVSATTLALLAAGLLYLVTPLDLVPDLIPVGGLLDDAAVLVAVVSRVRGELEAFRAWRRDGALLN